MEQHLAMTALQGQQVQSTGAIITELLIQTGFISAPAQAIMLQHALITETVFVMQEKHPNVKHAIAVLQNKKITA